MDSRAKETAFGAGAERRSPMEDFVSGYSIEVMPRTAAKIPDFRDVLPFGTRVYVAHIDGTPLDDMVRTAKRLTDEGFQVMPHLPARIFRDAAEFKKAVARYHEEAGVRQALLLAGGIAQPRGELHSSIQLLETGFLDAKGFDRIHVAGHPEGNRDIDPAGSTRNVDQALRLKQELLERTDAEVAVTTQFAFDPGKIISWAERVAGDGISFPVHVGLAGPTRLQTLLKFAIECGVGPSLKVIQRRARDVTKLLQPLEPTDVATELARYKRENPQSNIESLHLFPLGGILASAKWAERNGDFTPASRHLEAT